VRFFWPTESAEGFVRRSFQPGDLSDVFALQDEVTVNVVSAIQPKLLQTEEDLAARRPNDLSAYDLCLRAQHRQS
jgi:hypothetical protein